MNEKGGTVGLVCPDPDRWADCLAGLLPEAEAQALLRHATDCVACGRRLSVLTAALDEPDEEDQRILASLNSSQPAWQREVAARAARQGKRVLTVPRWLPVAAAVAVVAGPLVTWQWMRNQPAPPPERVLVERVVTAPVRQANAALLDLFPEGAIERSAGGVGGSGIRVPRVELVTVVLQEAPPGEVPVKLLDAAGKELWSGLAPKGEKFLVLDKQTIELRPLTIICGGVKYRVP